jgi:prolyl 4-hydroxylase
MLIDSIIKKDSGLITTSETAFKPSLVYSEEEGQTGRKIDKSVRDSLHLKPDRSDHVIQRIEQRVRALQGFDLAGPLEDLTVLRYSPGGHFSHHFDYYPDEVSKTLMDGNRATTFFVYLTANCTGGGTNFPRLKPPKDGAWCNFIDCDEPYDAGVTFRPIAGNAIFWDNLYSNGSGHPDVWHAGLPVTSGVKNGRESNLFLESMNN